MPQGQSLSADGVLRVQNRPKSVLARLMDSRIFELQYLVDRHQPMQLGLRCVFIRGAAAIARMRSAFAASTHKVGSRHRRTTGAGGGRNCADSRDSVRDVQTRLSGELTW